MERESFRKSEVTSIQNWQERPHYAYMALKRDFFFLGAKPSLVHAPLVFHAPAPFPTL